MLLTPRRSTLTRFAVVATLAASPLVLAGDPPAEADEKDLLRGPEVQVEEVPGVEESLTMEPDRYMRAAAQAPVPHRQFIQALRALASQDNAEIKPSEEQIAKVRSIEEAYQASLEAYRKANQRETRGLREVVGEDLERIRGRNRRDVIASLSEEKRDALKRLQEINQGAPPAEEAHALVWAELDEAQREWVTGWLDENVPARRRANDNMMMGGRGSDRAAPQRDAKPLTMDELSKRLAALPPAQQRFVLREIRPLLEKAEASAERADVPGMDGVEVPSMDGDDEMARRRGRGDGAGESDRPRERRRRGARGTGEDAPERD
jgi:DNA-binding Lrp family transcriptional regulator